MFLTQDHIQSALLLFVALVLFSLKYLPCGGIVKRIGKEDFSNDFAFCPTPFLKCILLPDYSFPFLLSPQSLPTTSSLSPFPHSTPPLFLFSKGQGSHGAYKTWHSLLFILRFKKQTNKQSRVSRVPGWFQTCFVAKDDLALPPDCKDRQAGTITRGLGSAGGLKPGLCACEIALYQLNYIPNPGFKILVDWFWLWFSVLPKPHT